MVCDFVVVVVGGGGMSLICLGALLGRDVRDVRRKLSLSHQERSS
jgi:hypothetical protein